MSPRPHFTWVTNLIGLLLYVGFIGFNYWNHFSQPAVARLWYPEDTSLRVADRLLAFDAIRGRFAEPLRFQSELLSVQGGYDTYARLALEECAAHLRAQSKDKIEGRLLLALAVVEAEAGNVETAARWLDQAAAQPESRIDAERLRDAYAVPPRPVSDPDGYATASQLPESWFYPMLQARFAESRGYATTAREWREYAGAELDRRRPAFHLLNFVGNGLLLAGVIGVFMWCRWPVGGGPLPVWWSFREGFGVFIWGGVLGEVVLLLLDILTSFLPPVGLADYFYTVLSSLPTVMLMYWRLCAPARLGLGDLLGLRFNGGIVRATLVLILVHTVADYLLFALLELRGPLPSVIEGVDEMLLWGTPGQRVLTMLNATLGAGIFEELVYRGVLFLTLRRWCGFAGAATLSSLVFAGVHFYGWAGFLSVGVFGFLQAWSVERTRSLVPAMLAHVAANFFLFGWQILLHA